MRPAPDAAGWFGRGLLQITHEPNYRKLGLTKVTALDLKTSVRATFDGMEKGLFTGKKLADYDYLITTNPAVPGYKYYASRAIVNGDTAANGAMVAGYAKAFETELVSAGYAAKATIPEVPKASVPTPKTEPAVTTPEQALAPSGNWLAALFSILAKLFGRKPA